MKRVLAAMMVLLPGAANAASAPALHSTEEYLSQCSGAAPGDVCLGAYVAANNWVRFNSDAQLCAPDQKTAFGSSDYDRAVAAQISQVSQWLKDNPQSVSLDYVQSMGHALIALYGCKP